MNDSREEELSWNMEEQGLSASNISRNSQMFMGYFIAAAANLLVVTVMLSLGCTMEILEIKKHLLKPKGIGIALFSQFGIMPLAAFSLAHVFQLNAIESVTVLICGCCPGGVLSSVFSLALKGDINLSILMTTTSTVLALGMMPLLLFIYSLVLDMEPIHNAVPLEKIIEILVLTVFPCCSGILINTKRPQYSGWVVKIAVGISAVVSILIVTLSFLYMRSDIFLILSPPLLYTSGLMTLIGYVLGYSISAAFKLNGQYRRTVSMETGCQNVQLCATILQVSFSPGVLGPMYAFPFLHVTLQILEGLLLILAFRLYQKIKATDATTILHLLENYNYIISSPWAQPFI